MSVNEKLMAPGTFSVNLNLEQTPNSIVNKIVPWGNIVLTPTRVQAEEFTDAQLRDMARYVGIVTAQEISEEGIEVSGKGILAYLGDSDSRGMVLARNAGTGAVRSFNRDTLDDVIDRSSSTPYGILRDESANQRAVRKGTVTEVSFDDTVLLLNYEGNDGDTTTSDGSEFTSNQVITFTGTSDISSDQAKFGNTSLNLTTDGFVTVADRPELDLTYQEFTVEWWEYRTSSSGNPTVWARNNDTYAPWIFGKAVSGRNKAFITHDGQGYGTDEDLNMDMGSIDLNQWNHFAISHKGDFFRTYKNGVQIAEVKRPELFVRVSSDSLQIGKGQDGNFFEGYLDGMVITRGTAKYWDAFTPSTSAPTATTANKTYTGKHYLESAYRSIKTICTALDAEFKMQNDGTIDVGPRSALFTGHEDSTPEGMIVRRLSGSDPNIKGYSGVDLSTEFNAEDFVSRVELTASQVGSTINLGQADAKDVPYKDLFGNELERIQILAENDIPDTMRDIRAEAYLNEYNKIQKTLNVGLEDYDISGDIDVGDIIYVYDPDVGFEDTATDAALENRDRFEITYQGQILHPIKIRVMGLSFPISDDMGVFYRDKDGNYTDLTDYVVFETGITQIEVGATTKTINQDLRATGAIISGGSTNEFTVPDAPTNLASATGSYQDGSGRPFAFARLTWDEPTNTDGSRITDGNMYRVRYRQVTDVDGNNLIDSNDNQVSDYEYLTVAFGTQAVVIKGLGPSNTYEFGVQAIDNSGFSGGYSILTAVQMPVDATVPPAPVAPTGTYGAIASNAAQIQISHKLAAAEDADGNPIASPTNFTLPRDIDHLNVYRSQDSTFTPSASTFVGEIAARAGHIDGQITAINTFIVSTAGTWYYKLTAVDVVGNESSPSTAQQAEHELITKEYIADAEITTVKIGEAQVTDAKIVDLTASKITAGTISGKEIIIDTDNDDPQNPVLGTIRSDNYVQNTDGWIIKSDGSVEFDSGTFRGDITGATGTFSGSLSSGISISAPVITGGSITGTSGSFTGDISGASGTFTGDLSGADISGGTIDIGSGTFQVDSSGNLTATSATITGSISSTSGTIGGWTIGSTDLSSGNISIDSTGSITGDYSSGTSGWSINSDGTAEFNNVTVRGTLDGPNLTGNLTGNTSSSIQVGGSSQDFVRLYYDNTFGGSIKFDAGGVDRFFADYDAVSKFSLRTGLNTDLEISSQGADLYLLSDRILFRDYPTGNDTPKIYLWNGSSYDIQTNKVLGTDSSGNLTFTTQSTSPVQSISGSGDISVSESNGAYTISHNDNNHSFAAVSHSHSTGDISGGVDNYDHWTLNVNGATDISSGETVSFTAGTNMGISRSGNTVSYSSPHSLSMANTTGNNSAYPFVTAVSSHTITRTRTSSATISAAGYSVNSSGGYVGAPGVGVTLWYSSLNSTSDETLKTGITDLTYGLDWINNLRPISYRYDTYTVYVCENDLSQIQYLNSDDICEHCQTQNTINTEEYNHQLEKFNNGEIEEEPVEPTLLSTGLNSQIAYWGNEKENWGFSAQEIEATLPTDPDLEIVEDTEFIDGNTKKVLDYNQMIAPLVKAVQELSAKNDELESRLAALEG